MHNRKAFLGIVILAIAIGLGYSYGTRQSGEGLRIPVVRSYNVPAGRADEVRNALNSLFWTKDGEAGNAQVFGNGLVVVRAPEGFQAGVESLVLFVV